MLRCATALFVSVLILTTILLEEKSYAQEIAPGYTARHWTTEDGLPTSEIIEIWNTSDGYMWLRTLEGLVRFDGAKFKLFNNGNTSAFESTAIRYVTGKEQAEFWFDNSSNGEGRYVRYKNGVFSSHSFGQDVINTHGTRLNAYELTSDGTLWVAGKDGLFTFSEDSFKRVFESDLQSSVIGLAIQNTSLWVAVENGFYRIQDKEVSHIPHNNEDLYSFIVDDIGSIWAQQKELLIRIEKDKIEQFELPETAPGRWYYMEADSLLPGQLLLSNVESAYVFQNGKFYKADDHTSGSVSDYNTQYKVQRSSQFGWIKARNSLSYKNELVINKLVPEFGGSFISPLFVDNQNQAWIGTGNGLYQYSKSLFTSYGNEDGINNVYPLFEDHDGAIWTSSNGGVISRVKDGAVEGLTENNQFNRVFSFYEDSNSNIWMGTSNDIQLWDRQSNTSKMVEAPFGGQGTRISVIQEKDKDQLYIGSRKGLYEYDIREKTWKKIVEKNGEEVRIAQLYKTKDEDIWVGSATKALFILKQDSLHAFKDNDQLSGINVRSLYKDTEGVLWVGFQGGGLNRIELSEDGMSATKITKYNPDNGLFGSVIHSILEDEYERFWMSSNQGIFWVDKKQLNDFASGGIARINPVIYQEEDGLPGNEANGAAQNSGLIASDGAFWFAMRFGMARIYPKDVQALAFSFPTLIESIISQDSVLRTENNEILLSKEQRDFEVEYVAFNYQLKSEDIQFSHKLEGHDEDWVFAGNTRKVAYQNLSPGSYAFKIKAGIGNKWDEAHISTINITIEPYFYETSWFFGFLIVIGASVFIGLIVWGNQKLEFQRAQYNLALQDQENAITENEAFLKELQEYIEPRIKQSTITAHELSSAMKVSERQLYRMIKNITGFTPQQFVREIRLKKARQILETQQVGTIAEVAYSVGFSTPFYFSKIFEERFEVHPGELIK
ncbi:MAG: helix-turn-helix domain-containing protein [Balneolaceae bacterium]